MLRRFGFESDRWLALVGCVVLELFGGTSYSFGLYSGQLKRALKYSQSNIQTVGSVGNVGLYASVICGLVFDYYGPKVSTICGVVCSFVGYMLLWAAGDRRIEGSVALVSLYSFLWSNGSAWYDVVAVSVGIVNFPENRGLIMGFLKAFFGLSASFVTVIYANAFAPNAMPFLLFLAVAVSSVGVCAVFLVRVVSRHEAKRLNRGEYKKLFAGVVFLCLLASYVAVSITLQDFDLIGPSLPWALALIPLCLPQIVLAMPSKWCGDIDGLSWEITEATEDEPLVTVIPEDELEARDSTLSQSMMSLDFWLLFLVQFIGVGSGLTLINNITQHVTANGGDEDSQVPYITILSLANCGGRLLFGALSDSFKARWTRPVWLSFAMIVMSAGMLLCAVADLSLLYTACGLTGAAYGAFWAVAPPVLADVYGNSNFASNFAVFSLSGALGSVAFSGQLAPRVYESNISEGDGTTCVGQECFRLTYFILAGCCAFGFFVNLLLTKRTAHFYKPHAPVAVPIKASDVADNVRLEVSDYGAHR